ncbi:DUF6349 family protein (plasmid) [Nocardia sp. CA-084685]|uniref:DUF6349 family protein n=1 Tax=Nocardia sp. CA-084685 TaxID=3239970 RepID=UPI003D974535
MEQIDIFDELKRIDDQRRAAQIAAHGLPRLYASPARGLQARAAEYTDWIARYGRFGCTYRARAWSVTVGDPDQPTKHCQATVLSADLRCVCYSPCHCVGALVYRGACSRCTWEGPTTTNRETAVLAALDHACPGWRNDPSVVPDPGDHTAHAHHQWAASIISQLGDRPNGWPITTLRTSLGTRAVPGRSPWGGYDIDARTLTTAAATPNQPPQSCAGLLGG